MSVVKILIQRTQVIDFVFRIGLEGAHLRLRKSLFVGELSHFRP